MTEQDRALPSALDAEFALLGALLLDDKAWPLVSSIVRPGDFYRDAHRRVFEAMARLVAAGSTPSDFVLLKNELTRVGELEEIGGPAYLSALVDGRPHGENAALYAEIIREKSRLRALIFAANNLLSSAYEQEETSEIMVRSSVDDLMKIWDGQVGQSFTIAEAVGNYVASLDVNTDSEKLPTGFADFDELTGGFRVGELTIVAARPSVGKSSWTLGAALAMARAGKRTAFFSLEMSAKALSGRTVAWGTRMSTHQLESGTFAESMGPRIAAAWTALDGIPLHIEKPIPTLSAINARCQQLQQLEGGLSCAIIDYLQLLSPEKRERNRQEEVSAMSRALKRLAEDRRLAVVACSALSRAPEGRNDKRPHLSDLRESGALEQDADTAALLFRPDMHSHKSEDKGMAEVIIAKQRNGPTGVVRMAFIDYLAQFVDLPKGS